LGAETWAYAELTITRSAYDVVVGNFYTSVTLRGPDRTTVVSAVKELGYCAFVSATASDLTVACEEQSDTQDEAIWLGVAQQLSQKLNCPALAVMNHDDDILCYALYRSGTPLDEYNSCPDYWATAGAADAPSGGNAQALCDAFGMPGNPVEVERILRRMPKYDDGEDEEGFVFEWERHAGLIKALDWPDVPYQQGFGYLKNESSSSSWQLVTNLAIS
jgi:hypothetical protein